MGWPLGTVLAAQLGLGLILSAAIAVVALRRRSLSPSGAWGAVLVGTVTFGFGGWVWGMLLISFFVLSSSLSGVGRSTKAKLVERYAKGSRRDIGQVLANGGAGALLALAAPWWHRPILLAAFLGTMATVNADTWATELGVLSRRPPRLLTSWKAVPPGTSGGVSALGTAATVTGAVAIGLALLLFLWLDAVLGGQGLAAAGRQGWWILLAAGLGGLAGSLFDSLLGATVQAIYYSPLTGEESERPVGSDGTPNLPLRGWRWLGNDQVNFISSIFGALVSALVWAGLG